jgi:hypothetical protein
MMYELKRPALVWFFLRNYLLDFFVMLSVDVGQACLLG